MCACLLPVPAKTTSIQSIIWNMRGLSYLEEADALEDLHGCGLVECFGDLENLTVSDIGPSLKRSRSFSEAEAQTKAREIMDLIDTMKELINRFSASAQ